MMIDDALLSRLEDLSRLRLMEGERQAVKAGLNQMLPLIAAVSSLHTAGTEELIHPLSACCRLREDEALPSTPRDAVLAGAPQQKDGYFKAPNTLD